MNCHPRRFSFNFQRYLSIHFYLQHLNVKEQEGLTTDWCVGYFYTCHKYFVHLRVHKILQCIMFAIHSYIKLNALKILNILCYYICHSSH